MHLDRSSQEQPKELVLEGQSTVGQSDYDRARLIAEANERDANNPDLILNSDGVDKWGYTIEDHEAGKYRSHGIIYSGWNDPGFYAE